jgi:hypothetical protein
MIPAVLKPCVADLLNACSTTTIETGTARGSKTGVLFPARASILLFAIVPRRV